MASDKKNPFLSLLPQSCYHMCLVAWTSVTQRLSLLCPYCMFFLLGSVLESDIALSSLPYCPPHSWNSLLSHWYCHFQKLNMLCWWTSLSEWVITCEIVYWCTYSSLDSDCRQGHKIEWVNRPNKIRVDNGRMMKLPSFSKYLTWWIPSLYVFPLMCPREFSSNPSLHRITVKESSADSLVQTSGFLVASKNLWWPNKTLQGPNHLFPQRHESQESRQSSLWRTFLLSYLYFRWLSKAESLTS